MEPKKNDPTGDIPLIFRSDVVTLHFVFINAQGLFYTHLSSVAIKLFDLTFFYDVREIRHAELELEEWDGERHVAAGVQMDISL